MKRYWKYMGCEVGSCRSRQPLPSNSQRTDFLHRNGHIKTSFLTWRTSQYPWPNKYPQVQGGMSHGGAMKLTVLSKEKQAIRRGSPRQFIHDLRKSKTSTIRSLTQIQGEQLPMRQMVLLKASRSSSTGPNMAVINRPHPESPGPYVAHDRQTRFELRKQSHPLLRTFPPS